MSFSKFLDPKNDYAFKRIFGTEKNKAILTHFLNDMLGLKKKERIQKVSFLKTIQDPEIASKKQSLVDVLCADENGRQYIVEMQVVRTPGFEKRAQYYAAKAYCSQLNEADQYHQLKEIIFLAITDFVMFPDKTAYKSKHGLLDRDSHSHDLKDFCFMFLELPKFTKGIEKLENLVEKWAYFFKHAEETKEKEVEKIVGSDAIMQQAYEALNRFSWSEIELRTYEQEEKRERDAQAIVEQRLLDIAAAETQSAARIAKAEAELQKTAAKVEAKRAEVETKRAEVETKRAEVEAMKAKYIEQGRLEGVKQAAKFMKQTGVQMEEIATHTELLKSEIDDL